MFSKAFDSGIIPMEFVNKMKKEGKLIMGIGHRVKSINNPDMRVQILKDFVKQHFPATPLLDYALEVEKITTSKVTRGWIAYCWRFFCLLLRQALV
ncbi:ATP-citrate synthase isoform X1 [Cricetulus griseus]|uniref:ATP-citrate synthase isoform X1 n=1 Tax=Cricetulus griseus TaxID=10029 RepID=UPI0007DA7A33|nr:ATP-citrate synthase isoform X1 [Cricetulus griseus]